MELSLNLGFRPIFSPVFGDFYDENVYWFGGLLDGMDWRKSFADAVDIALAHGDDALARELSFREQELYRQAEKGEYGYYRASPAQFDRFVCRCEEQFGGQDVYLLGMTEEIGYFLYYYQSLNTGFTIKGIALLEDVPKQLTSVVGIPLILAESLKGLTGKAVISCDSRQFTRCIECAVRELGSERVASMSADIVDARVGECLAKIGTESVILFGAGGFSSMLLKSTHLPKANIVGYSDNDKRKWGSLFEGRLVIPRKRFRLLPSMW
jgi:hypothetical protein